jgi:hypothetical protein
MKSRNWIFPILFALSGCGDECSSYSDYSCKQISKAKYNVYFYMPNGDQIYLGETEGLKSCGNSAWGYATQKNISENTEWGYICCMIAKGSSCYEKHR